MNKLSFNIVPSPATNDHEIRILIDDEDFLGSDYLGLDPPSFFNQDNFEQNGELLVGRCNCGVEGCCDYLLTVIVDQDTVLWTNNDGLNLIFERHDYIRSIDRARNDYSWENIKRKVERLTMNILHQSQTEDDYRFDWASARIKDHKITLSYSKKGEQKLFEIAWDGETEETAEASARQFYKENLKTR